MDATNNGAVSKLVKAWEAKNGERAKRVAGLGLMAVSLAACGGSDDTPYSQDDVDQLESEIETLTTTLATRTEERDDLQDAIDEATAQIEAAGADDLDDLIAQRDQLEEDLEAANADIDGLEEDIAALEQARTDLLADLAPFTDAVLTVNADLVITLDGDNALTATNLTYSAGDVIVDVSSADSDSLTIDTTAAIVATPTVLGYENIIINNTSNAVLSHALTGIADGTVTINNSLAAAATGATVTQAGDITVVAGTGVTGTLTVSMATTGGAATVVNSGAASAVVVNAQAATDTITVVAADDINLTANTASTLVLSGSGDVNLLAGAGLAGATGSVTGAAGQNLTVATAADVSGTTVSGFDSVAFSAATGALDARLIASDIALLNNTGANTLTIASGANVSLSNGVDVSLDIEDADVLTNVATGVANVTLAEESTGASIITISALGDTISTLNISTDADHEGANAVAISATTALTISLSGAGNVTISGASAYGLGSTLDASGLTGSLTANAVANLLSITGGTGDDTIFARTAVAFDLDGGTGADTLELAQDMTAGTFTGFEVLDTNTLGGNDAAFVSSQLNGLSAGVLITAGENLDIGALGVTTNTIDLSGLVFDTVTSGVDMTGATQNTAIILANSAMTITGTNGADVLLGFGGADVISGGLGDDIINGGAGVDNLTGGAGSDVFVLTDRTASDTVTDFVSTIDNVSLNGGAVAVVANTVAGIVAGTTMVFDTIANLGALGVTIGLDVVGNAGAGVNYAVASDTGAIFFDADGDWTAGSVQIGALGSVTLASTDFVI